MDDPSITIEEYIRLEEEKARRRGKVYNWETAMYGKIWDNKDVYDLGYVETEFPAIVFNDTLMSEPTVSSINDEIDFRVSFDDSDDENCTVIFDKNSFSYKIIFVNNLKTDSENDNDKVNMPLLPSPKPTVSYFDDLDFFKDFEKEFLAIVYNDAQTSKLDLLTEPILNPQHIDEFNLKDETSLSECDEEEQNVLYFNDLFTFNVVYPNDLKSDKDNDDKIDIKQSSGGNVINTDVGAYAHESNKFLETTHDTSNKFFKTKTFNKELNFNIITWNHLNKGMPFQFPNGLPYSTKYECAGDVVDFRTWLGISIRDRNDKYYGFRWSNLFKLITIRRPNTPDHQWKIRRINSCHSPKTTSGRPQRIKAQYTVSREAQYAVFKKRSPLPSPSSDSHHPAAASPPHKRCRVSSYTTSLLVAPAAPALAELALAAPALSSIPADFLPPRKRFGFINRVEATEREIETLRARLAAVERERVIDALQQEKIGRDVREVENRARL
ncbi:hypothetical protein Tco_1375880 [Tanacetum coccineum]